LSAAAVGAAPDRRVPAAVGLLMVNVLIWGAIPRVTAVGGEHAPALALVALRAVPTALVLVIALPLLRGRLPHDRGAWGWTALTGLLMVGGFLTGLTEAVILAGPGIAIVLSSTSPFWVALLDRFVFGNRIPLQVAIGLVVGFAGIVLIVSARLGGGDAMDVVLGGAAALGGAASWATGTMIVTSMIRRRPDIDLVGLTAGQYVVGGLVLLVVALLVDGTGRIDWGSGELWLAVAYISVVASAIATILYFTALRTLPPTRVTAWMFLTPVASIVLEIVLGHVPEPLVLVGMATTIAGVAVVNAAPLVAAERASS
jgi:drug/metabolite transporter (DMT)-like permease